MDYEASKIIIESVLAGDYERYLQRMVDYDEPRVYNHNILTAEESLTKLWSHNFMLQALMTECNNCGLDVYIGGSTGIWAILGGTNFIPDDIDAYIMNVTLEKLYALEQIIESLCPIKQYLSITYRPLHVNFDYHCENSPTIKIQVSLVNYTNIAQVFASYHFGIVCVAYSASSNEFVNMRGRFGLISPWNFTGIDNFGTMSMAIQKYQSRGFIGRGYGAQIPNPRFTIEGNQRLAHTFKIDLCPFDYPSSDDSRIDSLQYLDKERADARLDHYGNCKIPSVALLENVEFFPVVYMFYKLFDLEPIDYYVDYYALVQTFNYNKNAILCEHCKQKICTFSQLKTLSMRGQNYNIENFALSTAHVRNGGVILCEHAGLPVVNLWIPINDTRPPIKSAQKI